MGMCTEWKMTDWLKESITGSLYLYECMEDRRIDGKMMLWQTLRIQNVKNWRNCIQDGKKWKDIVEKAKTYKG
jgi:hypothetical protein